MSLQFDDIAEPCYDFGKRLAGFIPDSLSFVYTFLLFPLGLVSYVQTLLNFIVIGIFVSIAVIDQFVSGPRILFLAIVFWNVFAALFTFVSIGWVEVLKNCYWSVVLTYLSFIPVGILVWLVWLFFT